MLYLFQAPPQTAGQALLAHSSGADPSQPTPGAAHPTPRQVSQVGFGPLVW